MKHTVFYFLILLSILISSCTSSPTKTPETPTTETQATEVKANMALEITSNAFANGQSIPVKYSCKGNNISPDLAWKEPPTGTQSFALIVDDPDAPMGTWVHWVVYNLPANTRSLQENTNSNGMSAGKNSSGNMRYDGPCPPSGTHRYYFKLYALDTNLNLSPGATKEQVLNAMQGHVLAQGELMGTFSK